MDFSHIEPLNKDVPFELGHFQTKWLEALESGNYKQADGELWSKPGDAYCCLGVAAKLAGLAWVETENHYGFAFGSGGNQDVANGFLPNGFAETIGLRGIRGEFAQAIRPNPIACVANLSELNDHMKWPFAQIAAYIRHDPHNVFERAA